VPAQECAPQACPRAPRRSGRATISVNITFRTLSRSRSGVLAVVEPLAPRLDSTSPRDELVEPPGSRGRRHPRRRVQPGALERRPRSPATSRRPASRRRGSHNAALARARRSPSAMQTRSSARPCQPPPRNSMYVGRVVPSRRSPPCPGHGPPTAIEILDLGNQQPAPSRMLVPGSSPPRDRVWPGLRLPSASRIARRRSYAAAAGVGFRGRLRSLGVAL